MTRAEWRQKARDFAASARVLLRGGQYDSAYYLAGMAVECALKAKIAMRFRANTLPDKKLVNDIYREGHEIERLVDHAQLRDQLTAEGQRSAEFAANWAAVRAWNIDARYRHQSQAEAQDTVKAVTTRGTGVLSWIGRHW
jgi:HEPN domain-containing protein